MTANLRIQIARRADVMRVPNAALRFRPSNEMFAALNQPVPPEIQGGRGGRNAGGGAGRGRSGPEAASAPPPVAAAAPRGDSRSSAAPAAAPPSATLQSRGPRPEGSGGGFRRSDGESGRGRGGFGGGFGASGGDGGDRQARMLERLKGMSPDEQKQFIARMKERGVDTTAFDKALSPAAKGKAPSAPLKPKEAAATTIDALFAPLPTVVTQGRVWLAPDKQLKPVRVRLGITDGTNTELVDGELQTGTEVVTGVVLPTSSRPAAAGGNPLLQQGGRGGFGGGGFPGGGGGRGR
jgi:HlyD family secretion protein